MPHLFQGTKRCQRFTTVLAVAAFLTFPERREIAISSVLCSGLSVRRC